MRWNRLFAGHTVGVVPMSRPWPTLEMLDVLDGYNQIQDALRKRITGHKSDGSFVVMQKLDIANESEEIRKQQCLFVTDCTYCSWLLGGRNLVNHAHSHLSIDRLYYAVLLLLNANSCRRQAPNEPASHLYFSF